MSRTYIIGNGYLVIDINLITESLNDVEQQICSVDQAKEKKTYIELARSLFVRLNKFQFGCKWQQLFMNHLNIVR